MKSPQQLELNQPPANQVSRQSRGTSFRFVLGRSFGGFGCFCPSAAADFTTSQHLCPRFHPEADGNEVLVISLTPTWLLIRSNLIDVRVVEQPGRSGFSCLAPESGIRPPLVQSGLSLESFKSELTVKLDLDPVAKPTGSLGDSAASVRVRLRCTRQQLHGCSVTGGRGGVGGTEGAAGVRQDQEPA